MKKLFLLFFIQIWSNSAQLTAQQGLKGEYFAGRNFGNLVMTRTDPKIDFNWKRGTAPTSGMNPQDFSIRWTGRIQAPVSGTYTFSAMVDDGIRVWVGNTRIIDGWGMNDNVDFSGKVALEAGKKYELKVEYFNGLYEGEIHLLWELPTEKKSFFKHNYKPIGSEYFSQTPVVQPVVQVPTKPIVVIPKVVSKPTAPTQTKVTPSRNNRDVPSVKPNSTPSVKPINLDTVTKYTPKNVLFELSKPIMLPLSYTELDNLVAMLKRFPNKKVLVVGHTDNVGNAESNTKLSEQRAQAVVDYLIKKGISETRLTSQGFGGSRPISNENTVEGHAKNRRVEFIIK
jgi:outer membrane protein OmpA-like peptidoglycan-associated protein